MPRNIATTLALTLCILTLFAPGTVSAQEKTDKPGDPVTETPTPKTDPAKTDTPTPPNTPTNTGTPTQTGATAASNALSNGVQSTSQSVGAGNVLPLSNTIFTPLTQLPGIRDAASATSFSNFLNTLYKLTLGAGAVLAVIMIMVAGVQYMTSSGSVTSNSKAKERIQNALLGLLLVLAPTIVFGIINPSILNLDFASKLTGLQGANPTTPPGAGGPGGTATEPRQVQAINAAIQFCDIPATDAQKSCAVNQFINIFSTYADCYNRQVGINSVSSGAGDASGCLNSALVSARAAAHGCYPNLTNDNEACLEGQLTETARTYGASIATGCRTFSGTTVINTSAAETCCSAQRGCAVVAAQNNQKTCRCQAISPNAAPYNVETVTEMSDPTVSGGKCIFQEVVPYTDAQQCNAGGVAYLQRTNAAHLRGAARINCDGNLSHEFSPNSVYVAIRGLPTCPR